MPIADCISCLARLADALKVPSFPAVVDRRKRDISGGRAVIDFHKILKSRLVALKIAERFLLAAFAFLDDVRAPPIALQFVDCTISIW